MRRLAAFAGFAAALLAALFVAAPARADTIVLKNGRQIVAFNVTRADGKVHGETSTGELSLPESMVDHIVPDSVNTNEAARADPASADLRIGPPAADARAASDAVARLVVHDGAVDRSALARLDAAAASGAAGDLARGAAAETAAGRFAASRGDLAEALVHAERALAFAPEDPALLLEVAYVHLLRRESAVALEYLERARRVAPDSADAAKLAGWADYELNRVPLAVAEWKRAQQLRPDAEVARALDKAERDADAERDFREGESAHFVLLYSGGTAPELARAILPILEEDFDAISGELDYTPRDRIGVVLYTNQAFRDITRMPAWVGALNDGRIRIPVQGLAGVTPELAGVLKHELTHSFVAQKTEGRSPVWLQEGVAQWVEGKRSGNMAANLLSLYDHHEDPSLGALEGPWTALPQDYVAVAYAWSLAAIEAVVDAGGASDVERLLDRVATERSAETAVEQALHANYADLNRMTADYLRKTYLRSAR